MSTAAQNCCARPKPASVHGDGDARALGDVLERDRQEHKQREALGVGRERGADREPLRQAVHEQHPEHEQRPAHSRALELADMRIAVREEPAADQQEEHARRRVRPPPPPGCPRRGPGGSDPRLRPRSSAPRPGPRGGAAATPPAVLGETRARPRARWPAPWPRRRARARPRRSRRRAYFRPRSFPGTA